MERIVRKILNYDKIESRDEFIADIVALSLQILDQKGIYDSEGLNNLTVDTKDMEGGLSYQKSIEIDDNIFESDDKFLYSLAMLSHEVCHCAQSFKKENPSKNGSHLLYNIEHFNDLLIHIMLRENPELLRFVELYGLDFVVMREPEYNYLYNYFKSFYSLQEIEKEAYEFGIEFVENVIKIAENMELNIEEKAVLNSLKCCAKRQSRNLREGFDIMIDLRQDRRTVDLVRSRVEAVRRSFLDECPDYLEDLATMSEKDYNAKYSEILNPIPLLALSLEISYDDELAHKLMNALLSSQLKSKDFYIIDLPVYTDINLSEDEINGYKVIIEKWFRNYPGITYKTMMESKEILARDKEKYSSDSEFCK